ncbi:bifunctional diguanylate cyclase/phosphodiesterase [Paenibacillus sp. MWE-103]|uniref:Bifunctional diguanylate cyclase/phosphodiesterase n=1 Tax=Paenibacillus artemisiicola TaxID=1172618 RepID=A0ABS3WIE8_9BACL|nr:bifunctional diguanylate cyclase/phosphodiesterase [Paenibacillus artemisiicola]MBO7748099.1 bifunctional diguanylate cyclase/phosphodiesterase [Paenibacillus artemisiicola]
MNEQDYGSGTTYIARKGAPALGEVVDSLTGLPGRKAAFAMLARAVVLARQTGRRVLAALVDVDRFYIVNETKGTAFGDEALRQIARRLKRLEPWSGSVYRLSGNTFLLFRLAGWDAENDDADALVGALKQAAEERLSVRGEPLHPFCSIGVSGYPGDGETAERIVRHADTALRQAKAAGGNRVVFYAEDDMSEVSRTEQLRVSLRHAPAANALSLRYQPLYDAAGRLRGVEALLRWRHPELGDIPPAEFVPLAERSGQIVRIGEWVLAETCGMLRRARAKGMPPLVASVNLSPLQLRVPGFAETLRRILAQTGTKPEWLELEITESMMIGADEGVSEALRRIRAMGVRIALDDFGVGFASLTYLCKLPLHTLKLDRSFVRHLGSQDAEQVVVRTMIALAHELGFEVVAEGVETPEQLRLLREWGCDFFQGYLLAGPLDEEAVGPPLLRAARELFGAAGERLEPALRR